MNQAEKYEDFIRWQCRLRKHAMREGNGRPTQGMSAGIHAISGGEEQARINFLINRKNPAERTAEFRHIVRKTQDPSQWTKNGLRILAEMHYHENDQFVNPLTALFSIDSSIAYALLKAGQCSLRFTEGSVEYQFDFDVHSLDHDDEYYQATYWHNHLFNPTLPGKVRILAFTPRL